MPVPRALLTGLLLLSFISPAHAGLADLLDIFSGSGSGEQRSATESTTAGVPSDTEMVSALKEALDKGTRYAIDSLGREGGFLDNARVRIPMPDSLAWLEKTLRTLRQDRLADEFVTSMNRAAERAVPEAAAIFAEAVRTMTLEDARGILAGADDAATRYFRDRTGPALEMKLRPIVAEATSSAGVTASYKQMVAKAGGLSSLLSRESTDIDGYVTEKTLDGLFLMVAEEEKRIRENPLARTSDLLRKVFGSFSP
jgi:hypothetical protein